MLFSLLTVCPGGSRAWRGEEIAVETPKASFKEQSQLPSSNQILSPLKHNA